MAFTTLPPACGPAFPFGGEMWALGQLGEVQHGTGPRPSVSAAGHGSRSPRDSRSHSRSWPGPKGHLLSQQWGHPLARSQLPPTCIHLAFQPRPTLAGHQVLLCRQEHSHSDSEAWPDPVMPEGCMGEAGVTLPGAGVLLPADPGLWVGKRTIGGAESEGMGCCIPFLF